MEKSPENVLPERKISEIPCFRDSYLYGIGGGIGTALLYFMYSSKTRLSCHVGVAGFTATTLSYWMYCRYQWEEEEKKRKLLKQYMKEHLLNEGIEPPVLGEAVSV